MKPYVKCYVRGCPSRSASSNLKFFKLPVASKKTRAKWLRYTDRTLLYKVKNIYFCEKHFDDSAYTSTDHKRLIGAAQPTINLPSPFSSDDEDVYFVDTATSVSSIDTTITVTECHSAAASDSSLPHDDQDELSTAPEVQQFVSSCHYLTQSITSRLSPHPFSDDSIIHHVHFQDSETEDNLKQYSDHTYANISSRQPYTSSENNIHVHATSDHPYANISSRRPYTSSENNIHVHATSDHPYANISSRQPYTSSENNIHVQATSDHSYAAVHKIRVAQPSTSASSHFKDSIKLSDISCTRISELTPRKNYLYKYSQRLTRKLERMRSRFSEVQQKLKELSNPNNEMVASIEKLSKRISAAAILFLEAQCRNTFRKARGRRWTIDDKLQALSMYRRSPAGYTLLRAMFCLPTPRTLVSVLNSVPFACGINEQIFSTISKSMEGQSDNVKTCSILFDEMSVRQNLSYSVRLDRIEGYEDFGNRGRTNKIANRALVFMVLGLFRKWKQPVAYYHCYSGASSIMLKELITEVIESCQNTGLKVVATVCDMGTNNRKAVKLLGATKISPYFICGEERIFTFFDPPHLLKCTRNLLLAHNLNFQMKTDSNLEISGCAKWEHIKEAYKKDKGRFRFLHKLTGKHLHPQGRDKMRVKYAAQILSYTVSAAIYHLCSIDPTKAQSLHTAYFVEFMDQLFDSFNNCLATTVQRKLLTHCVTSKSVHQRFWVRAYKNISSWRFLDGDKPVGQPPSVEGWLITLRAVMALWQHLQKQGCKFLWTRSLNQDPLENLFGKIRFNCGSNHYPTTVQFVYALKTCIINSLSYQGVLKGTNCMDDNSDFLSDLRHFITSGKSSSARTCSRPSNTDVVVEENEVLHEMDVDDVEDAMDVEDVAHEMDEEHVVDVEIEMGEETIPFHEVTNSATGYVAGFIAKRVLIDCDCESCNVALCLSDEDDHEESDYLGMVYKEYGANDKWCLTYPTKILSKSVYQNATLIDNFLEYHGHEENIMKKLVSLIDDKGHFSWINNACETHGPVRKKQVTHVLCKVCIPWWCRRKNRLIKFTKF